MGGNFLGGAVALLYFLMFQLCGVTLAAAIYTNDSRQRRGQRAFNVAAVVVGIPVFVQHHSACFGAHLTAFADGWRCVLKAFEAASE